MSRSERTRERGRPARIPRRLFLSQSGLALLTPVLAAVLGSRQQAHSQQAQSQQAPRIKQCLFWFQSGGLSQIDTFDMKPEADSTVRGEFSPIASNTVGMPVCELLPRTSQHMDKLCVVRSMYHRMLCHNPAIYCAIAGREVGDSLAVSNRTFATFEDFPHCGSLVSKYTPPVPGLPSFVSLPFSLRNGKAPSPGQHAGFLGRAHDPFTLLKDPADPDFSVDELAVQTGLHSARMGQRQSLLELIDQTAVQIEQSPTLGAVQEYYRRAFQLLQSPQSREAFNLQAEDDRLRDRYGRGTVGQSLLLGRRLISAGVPFVSVYSPVANIDDPSWDTHLDNFPRLKNQLLPPFDQALSALLEDMSGTGLLEETLVVVSTEFGRTPQIGARRSNNSNNVTGRDHWPGCYTVLLAGAGITGGRYFGRSDRLGWHPKESPVHVGDFMATLLQALGVDPAQEMQDHLGRPFSLATGQPVAGLFA